MVISKEIRKKLDEYAPKYYSSNTEERKNICRKLNIDTFGGDCIGNGSGRNVFDMSVMGYPKLALKLAKPNDEYDGVKQNKHEIKLWNVLNSEQKTYLAPVLESGINNYWLIMPKGKPRPPVNYNWLDDAIYYLQDYVWGDDIQRENIARINNELKICDYGTPPQ